MYINAYKFLLLDSKTTMKRAEWHWFKQPKITNKSLTIDSRKANTSQWICNRITMIIL